MDSVFREAVAVQHVAENVLVLPSFLLGLVCGSRILFWSIIQLAPSRTG